MKTLSWQEEFDQQARRYHIIGAWVAITLNLVWAIGDYFEIPEYWLEFFYIRLAVSVVTLITLVIRKKLHIPPQWFIFVPFLGIALQNAYMYSVMDEAELQKHTFAYIALFIGAGMLILWKPIYSFLVITLNLIANLILFPLNSSLHLDEILINGGLLTFTVSIFTILLIHTRYTLTKKEIQSRIALEESKEEIEQQKHVIEEAHNEVTASINYAQRIQRALLAGDESWSKIGNDRFILFRPRDVVSGDFYWGYSNEKLAIWAAADCTGHGVPGAFMSMLGVGLLNEIVAEGNVYEPHRILNMLRSKIIHSLEKKGQKVKDGMDIALCVLHRDTNELHYAGAHNSLWVVRANEKGPIAVSDLPNPKRGMRVEEGETFSLTEVKADAMPIGKFTKDDVSFTTKRVQLMPGDTIYTFSDGYQDQFGGPDKGKYMSKTLKKFLLDICDQPCEKQELLLNEEFEQWMKTGDEPQLDDVCLIGVRV